MKRDIQFILLLIVPMGLYYLSLGIMPQYMATKQWFGWPLSLLFGVVAILWGAAVALFFAYYKGRKLEGEEDE